MATAFEFTTSFDPEEMPPGPVRRFTVQEYHELIERGFFAEDEAYELIEGWLVHKMTKGDEHERVLELLHEVLTTHFAGAYRCRCQLAITLADGEPEPDISVVAASPRKRGERKPLGSAVLLVIEVADSTLAIDRGPKLRSYARAGIPEFWIVNLAQQQIEVYKSPQPEGTYADQSIVRGIDQVTIALAGSAALEVVVSDLFA